VGLEYNTLDVPYPSSRDQSAELNIFSKNRGSADANFANILEDSFISNVKK
jgi:hypothetical protein